MNNIKTLSTDNIYPCYELNEIQIWIDLQTYIRKEKDGIWYLIPIRMQHEFPRSIDPDDDTKLIIKDTNRDLMKDQLYKRFQDECYRTLLLYIIDPNHEDMFGHCLFFKDVKQMPETERLLLNRY